MKIKGQTKCQRPGLVGLANTKTIRKIRTDILGNQYVCEREKFRLEVDC